MASSSEKIEDMKLDEFPWGMMIEVVEKFTFHQLINFQDNVEPVALPKLLGSSLKKSKFVKISDLIILKAPKVYHQIFK